jgi:DNA-binding IclR family transcriptional regulator
MTATTGDTLVSVERALSMLELLGRSGPLTVTQLARRLGINKTTAFRMAQTLVARDWVVKSADRTYRLGPGILGLAISSNHGQQLIGDMRPLLEHLYEATGETIHLTRLDGRHVVYLEQIVSNQPVRSVAAIGARSPAHCVSPGLAQLAHLPAAQLEWFLSVPLQRHTPSSITTVEGLRRELERVHDRGFAINLGGYRPDVGGVGSAVLDPKTLTPIAGISVCGPVYRLKSRELDDLGALVRAAAEDAALILANSHQN